MEQLFPVLPFRSELYTPEELFDGFDPTVSGSYARTPDFAAYRSTLLAPNREVGMLRALHDQSITEQRTTLLAGRRVVAIMGGHALARDDPRYLSVALVARRLAREGHLVVSGGGPGAMEATHLGAVLAPAGDLALQEALAVLADAPRFPESRTLVAPGGAVDTGALEALHRWQAPAFAVLGGIHPAGRGESLAVPTWFYGHEPPTPFATRIAKYFSNPLREDGLLSIAVDGVIYAPGRVGTVQEIFQDATQNVYRLVDGRFSPMVLLDLDGCWSSTLPVIPLLRELFGPEQFDDSVLLTTDLDEVVRFLAR